MPPDLGHLYCLERFGKCGVVGGSMLLAVGFENLKSQHFKFVLSASCLKFKM